MRTLPVCCTRKTHLNFFYLWSYCFVLFFRSAQTQLWREFARGVEVKGVCVTWRQISALEVPVANFWPCVFTLYLIIHFFFDQLTSGCAVFYIVAIPVRFSEEPLQFAETSKTRDAHPEVAWPGDDQIAQTKAFVGLNFMNSVKTMSFGLLAAASFINQTQPRFPITWILALEASKTGIFQCIHIMNAKHIYQEPNAS